MCGSGKGGLDLSFVGYVVDYVLDYVLVELLGEIGVNVFDCFFVMIG